MIIDKGKALKVLEFWRDNALAKDLTDRYQATLPVNSEITDILGVRRSGKSAIMKLIIKNLKLKDDFIYLNFEDPYFIENNTVLHLEELIEIYKDYISDKVRYLFLDEIQEIENWQRLVRKYRDSKLYKIYITGSSSKLLSGDLATLLTGRHISVLISPLSFREFLTFKKIEPLSKKDILLKKHFLLKKFYEYVENGGFPEVVLSENFELLKYYFNDIIQKDIIARYEIRQKNILERMAVYVISNSAKTITLESIKKTFSISFALANKYLSYFKDAFLIYEVKQFSFSLKRQEKAIKKYYCIDTGLANMVSFKFTEDRGRMLENVIFLELNRKHKVYYYKTKNNHEVDFLVEEKGKIIKLIQVAWSISDAETKERETRALREAMQELKIKKAEIITFEDEGSIDLDGNKVVVIPAFKYLLGF